MKNFIDNGKYFEIKNIVYNMIMTKSFEFGLNKIADAFQKRAEDLFSNT